MNPLIRMFVGGKLKNFLSASWLEGYRTQLVAVAYALVTFGQMMNWFPDAATPEAIKDLLMGTGLVTASAKVKNVGKKVQQQVDVAIAQPPPTASL